MEERVVVLAQPRGVRGSRVLTVFTAAGHGSVRYV